MMFHNSLQLAVAYMRKTTSAGTPGFEIEIAKEIVARLRQLDWLYQQVETHERRVIAMGEAMDEARTGQPETQTIWVFMASDVSRDPTSALTVPEKLRIFGEAFYQTAWRLVVILAECLEALPGLKSIEAAGIKRVRNNLIEHANRERQGRPSYTFSVSRNGGLRLRPAARVDEPDVYVDNGVRINALELRSELESMLRAAVGSTDDAASCSGTTAPSADPC